MRADSPLVDALRPSPNFGDRVGPPPDAVVLHYTGMPTADGALARLADPQAQVSAHYVVLEDGRIVGEGTHEELLVSCPTYAEIVASQFKAEEAAA